MDMNDTPEQGAPKEQVLYDNLGKIAYTLDKAYLESLTTAYCPVPWDSYSQLNPEQSESTDDCRPTYKYNIRGLQVKRWVFDKDEKPGECFKNVMSLFADGDHTVAMVVFRRPDKSEVFFVVKNDGKGREEDSKANAELLKDALIGNFPGTQAELIGPDYAFPSGWEKSEDPDADRPDIQYLEHLFSFTSARSVAILANSPSEYSEDYLTQGIDKLLNGVTPQSEDESYAVVFLAESLSQEAVRGIIEGYQDIATDIHPFSEYQLQVGSNESEARGEMRSVTDTVGTSYAITKTHSIHVGGSYSKHEDKTRSFGIGGSRSTSESNGSSESKQESKAISGGISAGFKAFGATLGGTLAKATGTSKYFAIAKAVTHLFNANWTRTRGHAYGVNTGYGYSWGTTRTESRSTATTTGTSRTVTTGLSKADTYSYKSYMVSDLLDRLSKTVERLTAGKATGLWKYATYVLANDAKSSVSIANYLRALSQGKDSYLEPPIIQEWSKKDTYDVEGGYEFDEILKYLSHFTHPIFITADDEEGTNAMAVTPTSYVSTDEISQVIAFPRKSVVGIPVLESVRFGREPHSLSKLYGNILLGRAYHMYQTEAAPIYISKEHLTAHTFVTGSTGAGKSNAIYVLLEKICLENASDNTPHFLVVEPAKGEYKNVFGHIAGVSVYGTNPDITSLLRINPFSFPEGIRIDEHMDRLVELFNVCWPMYAAMPAILKDAVEKAYQDAGWNLETSRNTSGSRVFPTFADVLEQIVQIVEGSSYSNESKSDYKGALCTRVKSLTNGINRMIFTADELTDDELFDRNVIVDLSRVGSTETRSLLMGVMVMKLNEYRMAKGGMDSKLRHITVLEEAHQLLKRTSNEQLSESANLLGKSVEMLTSAIAEMRTYGEGFIIADQAPGLLDMAVIRNTNTKIILRLPDKADRELVGKAAGLNDQQIDQLARLERGVAAVFQNDWLEPVLCKVDHYPHNNETFMQPDIRQGGDKMKRFRAALVYFVSDKPKFMAVGMSDEGLREAVRLIDCPGRTKIRLLAMSNEYQKKHYLRCWSNSSSDLLKEQAQMIEDILGLTETVNHLVLTIQDEYDLWAHLNTAVYEKMGTVDPAVNEYLLRLYCDTAQDAIRLEKWKHTLFAERK